MKQDTMTPAENQTTGANLFRYPWIATVCRSRYFPLVIQTFTIVLLALIFYDGFHGKQSPLENFAIVGPWSLFYPIAIILTLVFCGRIWCAVCPMGAISAACERASQKRRRFPNRLKRPALILSLISFVFLVWAFGEAWGIRDVPSHSALFIAIFLVVAIVKGLMFKGRPFCRYLCPITLPLNLFSRVSPLEIRADRPICRTCGTKDCAKGNQMVEGCPMDLFPAVMEGMSNCIYCMKCIKACPRDALKLYTRPFGRELLSVNKNGVIESLTAMALIGIFPLMMSYMTIGNTLFDKPLRAVSRLFAGFLSRPMDDGIVHLSSTILWVGVATGLFALASLAAGRMLKMKFKHALSVFGPPFVLITVVDRLGYVISRILANGGTLLSYLSSSIGVYFYHTPNIINLRALKPLDTTNSLARLPIGFLLTAGTVYFVARKVDRSKAVAATLPYIILLMILLFIRYNRMFASLGLPYL